MIRILVISGLIGLLVTIMYCVCPDALKHEMTTHPAAQSAQAAVREAVELLHRHIGDAPDVYDAERARV